MSTVGNKGGVPVAKKKKEIEDILIRQKKIAAFCHMFPIRPVCERTRIDVARTVMAETMTFQTSLQVMRQVGAMLSSMTSPSIVRERSPTPGGLTFRRQGCSFALIHLRNSTTQAKASQ